MLISVLIYGICSLFSSEEWKCSTKRIQLFLFPSWYMHLLALQHPGSWGITNAVHEWGHRERRRNLCISSAHTFIPLSHWISLTKHPSKEKILKELQDSDSRALNQAQGPSEHRVWADCTGCWPMKLALLSTQFHLRQQSKVKRSNRNSLLFDAGWEANHPSSYRSPNQEYNLIIQKEGKIIVPHLWAWTWTRDQL